jgi:hypothetical protein
VHDVVASVVRASVPQAMALFMHRFLAEHLVRRHGDHRAHVATIATHWAAAGEPLRAARAYRLAAEAARDATLPALQAELLDDAAVLLADDGSGPGARFRGRRLTLTLRWHRLQRRPATAASPDEADAADSPDSAVAVLCDELRAQAAQMASPFNRALMVLELARQQPAAKAHAEALAIADLPAAHQRPGLRLHALALAAAAARDAGLAGPARRLAAEARALAIQCAPFDLGPAELTRLLLQAEAAPP